MVSYIQNCPFDVNPYDQSRVIRNPDLKILNYTNQDFWSLKARLINLMKERMGDKFNNFVECDFSVMLMENAAFVGDMLSFKIDQLANELFIDTVTEKENMFRLAQLIGFKPTPPVGSRSLWISALGASLDVDLFIETPIRIPLDVESGRRYIELYAADNKNEPMFGEDIIITAGSLSTTSIIGIEGSTRAETFAGNGEINQVLALGYGPVIWQSIRVVVDGVQWEEVDYFTDSQQRREYRIEYDSNYSAFVIFGNNRAGLIPSLRSEIIIEYRVGGGPEGDIVTGSLETQRSIPVPDQGFSVPVVFRNYTKGEFGYSGDEIDDIRRKIPPYLRSQNRAVTGDDYQSIADQFSTPYNGQIGKSTAVLRNRGCAANVIDLYILARDSRNNLIEANNELKVALQQEINIKKMITHNVCIKDGVVLYVDIAIDVTLDKFFRKFEEEYKQQVVSRVDGFFSLNNWEFGQDLREQDVVKILSDIPQFRRIDISFETSDEDNSGTEVSAKFYEIIRPDNIQINFVFE